MRSCVLWIASLVVFLLPPATAWPDDQLPGAPDYSDLPSDGLPPVEQARRVWVAQHVGKVTRVNHAVRTLNVQVRYKVTTPNQDALRQLAQLQRQEVAQQLELRNATARAAQEQMRRLAQSRTNRGRYSPPNVSYVHQAQQRLRDTANRMAQTRRNLYRIEEKQKDVPLEAAEDAKVRVSRPPIEFDNKGRLRQYTKEELAALKGKEKLWGYPADFERLAVGQTVRAYVARDSSAADEFPLTHVIYIVQDQVP
jgi:hypothetical protein